MTCEKLASGTSLLHTADPRLKIILAVAFSVITAVLTSPMAQVLSLLGGAALAALALLSFRLLLSRLLLVNIFIAFLWLVLPWSTPGETAFNVGPADISSEGIRLALGITLKCNAIVLANMALLSTSTVFSLAHALAHMRAPSKLVQLFFFSWRYLHVMDLEYKRMVRSLKARGFAPGTDLRTYRTYGWLLGNLFIRSYERGERVYKAMLCRGFDGTFWILSHFHLHGRDLALTGTVAAYLAMLAGLEWWPA